MSLRWIQETQPAPTCDEESSDIEDSCSDDSYDSDVSANDEDVVDDGHRRQKRETRRHATTTVTFREDGSPLVEKPERPAHCVIWDPRQPAQDPIYGANAIQLYCRTGYHLAITAAGRVRGLSSNNEQHAFLSITAVSFGIVRIRGVETGLYLAFNEKGQLYGEPNVDRDNTEWEQWKIGSYDAFRSRKYAASSWWIGIKRNGRPKPGPKTAWGQKAIQFVPRDVQ